MYVGNTLLFPSMRADREMLGTCYISETVPSVRTVHRAHISSTSTYVLDTSGSPAHMLGVVVSCWPQVTDQRFALRLYKHMEQAAVTLKLPLYLDYFFC